MSVDTDLKACSILERFSAELVEAEVDYTCTQDLHQFMVTTGGITREIGFAQRVLELTEIPDIEQVVNKLIDQIKAGSAPRRIRVHTRAA